MSTTVKRYMRLRLQGADTPVDPIGSIDLNAVSADLDLGALGWYTAFKPFCDAVLSLTLLVLTAPVVLLAALLVKLTSPGPAFYTQTRVGKDGQLFTIFKLRTMTHNCEARSGAVWSSTYDPRVTPLGKFLRKTHLDELPQLVNVILGHMSLIGPRPERPEIVTVLQDKIDGYTDRLDVRPGITGLAQVQLPPDVDLPSVRRKLVCDLYYIEHLTAWLDLRLLICTGLLMVGVPLRISRRLLRIPQPLRRPG